MDTVELLAKFANPEVMQSLSLMNKLTAGLITTVLGMGITFISLIILQIAIVLMARFTNGKFKKFKIVKKKDVHAAVAPATTGKLTVQQEEEVVAAIITCLAIQLETSVSNIVIRNIERVGESSTAWHSAGIADHMNN